MNRSHQSIPAAPSASLSDTIRNMRVVYHRKEKPIIFPEAAAQMLGDMQRRPGVELLWVGYANSHGQIYDVGLATVGEEDHVDFSSILLTQNWVLIHNHVNDDDIVPSNLDLIAATRGMEHGCGNYICNNDLSKWIILATPSETSLATPSETPRKGNKIMKRIFLVALDESELAIFDRWKKASSTNAVTALMAPLTRAMNTGDLIEITENNLEQVAQRKDEIGKLAKEIMGGKRERGRDLRHKHGYYPERIQMAIFDNFCSNFFSSI